MTGEELKTALKRYGFDESDPLLTWLNAAYHEILSEDDWLFLETVAELPLLVGASAFAELPTDFFQLKTVSEVTSGEQTVYLKYIENRRFYREFWDNLAGASRPLYYTLVGLDGLELFPKTDKERLYRVAYERDASSLTTSTSPIFPERFHYGVVLRAAAIALMAESEEDRASVVQDEYDIVIGKMRLKYARKEQGEPAQVEDVMGYNHG